MRATAISCLLTAFLCFSPSGRAADSYRILVSEGTWKDAEWKKVAEALQAAHEGAEIQTFPDGIPGRAIDGLKKARPSHVGFVARHEEVTKAFVSSVHQMMRGLDEDPYADAFWGIVTGFDAANALEIARKKEPLIVKRVASGTDVALEQCIEGVWYCELRKNRMVRKEPGGQPESLKGPDDTTKALVDTLNEYKADLFVTSGHATERDWQIGFRYKNGYFRSKNGSLFGEDTAGKKFLIHSPNPKVYMPIGNCLMGHIDGADAMALAWLNSAGVQQMLGYTVPTWYGYAGWGCLDYFVEQPGRYTFTEAFFANHHALIHRLETCFPEAARESLATPDAAMKLRGKLKPSAAARELKLRAQDGVGLMFDRDAVVFYGDPGWSARMAQGPLAYEQKLEKTGDSEWTFTITPKRGEKSFQPINTNGSQRGWRPMVAYFPERLKNVKVLDGEELKPVLADDFILVPNPRKCDPSKKYLVTFTAEPIRE